MDYNLEYFCSLSPFVTEQAYFSLALCLLSGQFVINYFHGLDSWSPSILAAWHSL